MRIAAKEIEKVVVRRELSRVSVVSVAGIDVSVWCRACRAGVGVKLSRACARAGKIEVVAGCGWGRRARVRPLHALGRAAGVMLASQRSQSCNEEGAFFGARALRRPRGKGSGSPTC
ncbi:hypothetical protein PYW08_005581 [Mythimna loreyi]|uniref:Uncharacterized protein n=1 Tax=Mythimna loreyi TaxID=667449 RepID=A0ACC2QGZ1_9NEOP|nr:hypothetical protein PYW08_005581 [Mythimna loreyi]